MGTATVATYTAPNRGIATMTDTGSHILCQCDMKSSAAITAAGGTVVGTPTIDVDGYTPSANNYVHFSALTGYGSLDYAGQITFKVPTQSIASYDDDVTSVSLSNGSALSSSQYLISGKSSTPSNEAFLYISTSTQLTMKMNAADTAAVCGVTSRGKATLSTVTMFWKGNLFGLVVDGRLLVSGTRAAFTSGAWAKIALGVGFVYTVATQMFTGRMSDLVVSRIPPTYYVHKAFKSLAIFGDSFAYQTNDITVPRYDKNLVASFTKDLYALGLAARIEVEGYPGATICDTGSNDLSSHIATFAARNAEVSVIFGFNNDATALAADVTNVTTGSDANIKSFINTIAANTANKLIYVATPGSLKQDATLDTPTNTTQRDSLITIVEALPAWWDAANPTDTGRVIVIPLFTLLGDSTINYNYIGQADLYGNGFNTPALDNRHPFVDGWDLIEAWLFNDIKNRLILA